LYVYSIRGKKLTSSATRKTIISSWPYKEIFNFLDKKKGKTNIPYVSSPGNPFSPIGPFSPGTPEMNRYLRGFIYKKKKIQYYHQGLVIQEGQEDLNEE